ncbi:MAG: UDP-N-acetylmuramate:L-alanyl-gamma-D-glutamyl-meso-diaminopimelate ligase [Gammaproteobacteria bacterium]|nr:UDP-N-acetylmuramate:L-alanyl-gamma-D-glutamyl-meso-diaminopimelate ligase [Gammaproteobacteria bacterium]
MHIHILGICGTFMGGIALLARERGVQVSGSDANVYPPMSTQLREQGIGLHEGYDTDALDPAPDCVVIGNALSRGNPAVEKVLSAGMPYTSGPQWLADHVLQGRWVLAVSGTHGKTSTASMLAWILEYAGMNPGFLIGGVPQNFGVSARLGEAPFFVVEADEYDTAFFDKRSKFVHYRPRTLVMNNLEYDHADIFPDMAAIRTQFHHLIRTVPGDGLIVSKAGDAELEAVLETGCWTFVERFTTTDMAAAWRAVPQQADGSVFDVLLDGQVVGTVRWGQLGEHNMQNALGAIAAARHGGVPVEQSIAALTEYLGVRRRMEVRGTVNGVTVYDDFAHHPTAIATTLQGLRKRVGDARILVLLEPRSNTMKMGVHRDTLAKSLEGADYVWLHTPDDLGWSLADSMPAGLERMTVSKSVDEIVAHVAAMARPGDHLLVMSNGGFGGIHERLLGAL